MFRGLLEECHFLFHLVPLETLARHRDLMHDCPFFSPVLPSLPGRPVPAVFHHGIQVPVNAPLLGAIS